MNAKYHWFRWLCGAAAFLALAFAVGWFYEDVVKPARHAAMCKIHIKQLLTALHAYHDRHQCFPPAYTVGSDGERWHSWRVLLLPDLGEQKLYDAYRFDEPWNGPHNAPLGQRMPAVFGFPGEPQAKFLAVTGRHTAWPNYLSSRISEFTDGMSDSILLVESADSEVNWLEPRDIPYGLAVKRREAAVGPRLVGRFGGTTVGLADGRVRPFPESFEKRLLASILTVGSTGENLLPERNGEPLPPQAFPPQRESSLFAMTDVLPYPSMPLSHGRNYLYCATFRIA